MVSMPILKVTGRCSSHLNSAGRHHMKSLVRSRPSMGGPITSDESYMNAFMDDAPNIPTRMAMPVDKLSIRTIK